MEHCLNCGQETIFPPVCDACMSTSHREGCRCQACFDRLCKELAAERDAVRVLGEKHKVLVEEVDSLRSIVKVKREPWCGHMETMLKMADAAEHEALRVYFARAATDAAKAREGA